MDVIKRAESGAIDTYSASAQHYAANSQADNTTLAYRGAWGRFEDWCAGTGHHARPASHSTVVDYLAHLADEGLKLSTIRVARAAIAAAHIAGGGMDPTKHSDVKLVMKGIARQVGSPPRKKAALSLDDLRAMVDTLDTSTIMGKRDKALLLLGFAGAFRRSELVALDVADLRLNGKIIVTLKRSKTDQAGAGLTKHIIARENEPDFCPVAALVDYLDAAAIRSGPVFRRLDRAAQPTAQRLTAHSVAYVIKRAARAAGLDARAISGHSLRSGFISEAHRAGAADIDIMAQTGHQTHDTLRGYVQDQGLGAGRAMLAAFGNGDEA